MNFTQSMAVKVLKIYCLFQITYWGWIDLQKYQMSVLSEASENKMDTSASSTVTSVTVSSSNYKDTVDICHTKVPKSILLQIFQYFDRETLRAASEVSKSFHELSKHPALWNNAVYSG